MMSEFGVKTFELVVGLLFELSPLLELNESVVELPGLVMSLLEQETFEKFSSLARVLSHSVGSAAFSEHAKNTVAHATEKIA